MKLELVHYGHKNFDITQFNKIKNDNFIKPKGGFWASPIISSYGWIDWCKENNFGRLDNYFFLEYVGNILIIDSLDDLKNKVSFIKYKDYNYILHIDFEKLSKKYDAMLLTEKGEKETRFTHPENLYGWDCESICIFNPKGVKS
jgi:hypothetical protein